MSCAAKSIYKSIADLYHSSCRCYTMFVVDMFFHCTRRAWPSTSSWVLWRWSWTNWNPWRMWLCASDVPWWWDEDRIFSAWEGHKKNYGIFCYKWFLLVEFDLRIIKLCAFCKTFCSCGLGWNIEISGHCLLLGVFVYVEIVLFSLICSESFSLHPFKVMLIWQSTGNSFHFPWTLEV